MGVLKCAQVCSGVLRCAVHGGQVVFPFWSQVPHTLRHSFQRGAVWLCLRVHQEQETRLHKAFKEGLGWPWGKPLRAGIRDLS